jgi:succinyl-CoA synthetase alpha subunit
MLGEIGGDAEIQAAAVLKDYRKSAMAAGEVPKPVVGMVNGRTAPKGRTMGHAGAISGSDRITVEDQIRAMEDAGIVIPTHPGDIGPIMKGLLDY